ncbi:concanavalin A-like lectin/glucanase domain-containing protein [Clohesyomyces aquaticus]|uniref:endo-1,3(4)-beta-glucanase n=1 Tax=Clohesyomyces aquaticus TaxID=1231657 RepID=A0A1Y1Z3V4_9PLEO|nr:concanavalin A-like lectin/glucanase domain-containing protein [Clohesyomyces aquaticus]
MGTRANAYPNYSKLNYKLEDTYSGPDFFSNFDYFTGYDPSHGFVHYVDAAGSNATNLTSISSTSSSPSTAILRVDSSDQNATTGRRSVRITSQKQYSSGLFIFDILHTPYGCATWPALWLTDPANWPANGEIDIVEAVNAGNTGNQVTLHTSQGCKVGKHRKRKQTGRAAGYDCWNMTNGNEGCGVQGPVESFGEKFNEGGGGVYAMEWRTQGIRVWMFPRNSLPADISAVVSSSSNSSNSAVPDPSTWSTPLADFPNTECDIGTHFKNQSIVANIDLCGDWAGRPTVFDTGSCTGLCSDWVAFKASGFDQAYWEFGGWWVYGAV